MGCVCACVCTERLVVDAALFLKLNPCLLFAGKIHAWTVLFMAGGLGCSLPPLSSFISLPPLFTPALPNTSLSCG